MMMLEIKDDATNRDILQEIFPNVEIETHIDSILGVASGFDVKVYIGQKTYFSFWVPSKWLNAKYERSKRPFYADEWN